MEENQKALEVPETRAEPAPASPPTSPSPPTPPAPPPASDPSIQRAPGDSRGFPARPKDAKGDYEKDPWGESWWPREQRKRNRR